MIDLIKHLNNKIIINDLIVRNMKYEVNMLFYDYPSKEKAKLLALKINGQLDTALIGLHSTDKELARKELIRNSFLVLPNPVSDQINYGHVFTTLTNMKPDEVTYNTTKRLTHWLDLNTEVSYDEHLISRYITQYKITDQSPEIKVAAIEYEPKQKPIQIPKYKYRLRKRVIWIPITLISVFYLAFISDKNIATIPIDIPPVFENTLDAGATTFIDNYYDQLQENRINPYIFETLDFNTTYQYLKDKNSQLVEQDYLFTINRLSEPYNINPLLLIAIIGQEQNFVPSDHEFALEIINNPYNVYGSWENYCTDFEEATEIALNTIQSALETRPEDIDLIDWLNNTYAEDENWSIGVKSIFTKLQSLN